MPKDIIHNTTQNQDFNAGFIAGVKSTDRPCTIAAWITVIAILSVGMLIGWALTNYVNVFGG